MTNHVVHCSHCDTGVKIKEEHLGRKLRCPRCKEVFVAEAELHATTSAQREAPSGTSVQKKVQPRPSAPREPHYDDEEVEQRPRRRKKKRKKKSSPVLMWSLIAGGGVLLIAAAIVLFLLLGNNNQQKPVAKKNPPPPPINAPIPNPMPNNQGPPIQQPQPKPKSGLARLLDIQTVKNLMRNLGLAYRTYEASIGKGPPNQKALSGYYEKNRQINEMLAKGYWKFYYNVAVRQMPNGASNTIIAHEIVADDRGQRVVVMGDGSVHVLDEATFKKTPKAGK